MIKGFVKNKENEPLARVQVELKDGRFDTQIACETDENGYFEWNADRGVFPYMTAVREYAENYLEFWAHNVDISADHMFDIRIGKNEIYGINVFCVSGAAYPLFVYFRPMSLKKYQENGADKIHIAPDITKDSVRVTLDGVQTEIFSLQEVRESVSENETMTAYLVQLKTASPRWKRIRIEICDCDSEIGMAEIFNRSE